ncbi:MAG: hypothetical protein JWO98_3594 [Frankiales bacterium]|nr:hypothetical protein [Frankiales bacterium]
MFLRTFGGSFVVTIVALAAAFAYGGTPALVLAAILGVLEVSLSFDNAVVNATVLKKLSHAWRRIFLTVGVLIAVVGMRLIFPILIVSATAKLSPVEVVRLALQAGDPNTPGTYGFLLREAHPAIAAFGGAFLLLLFLNFVFEERELTWLTWLERPLARVGKLDQLAVVVTLLFIVGAAYLFAPAGRIATVLLAGILGTVTYILVDGLGSFFETTMEDEDEDADVPVPEDVPGIHGDPATIGEAVDRPTSRATALLVGKAAFASFLYLEVLDASFSFDGVVGAFAITSDPILIALGLGIGALFIRSLTVYLVNKGTLDEYAYLEHGALWAIGALAVILLVTIRYEVPEVVTGLIGVGFILAAFISSLVRNRRRADGSGPTLGGEPAEMARSAKA